jgi:hypothetical protein
MATLQLQQIQETSVSDSDRHVAAAWDKTVFEWSYILTPLERVHLRANVASAPNFGK